jgi:hypothetical protein
VAKKFKLKQFTKNLQNFTYFYNLNFVIARIDFLIVFRNKYFFKTPTRPRFSDSDNEDGVQGRIDIEKRVYEKRLQDKFQKS